MSGAEKPRAGKRGLRGAPKPRPRKATEGVRAAGGNGSDERFADLVGDLDGLRPLPRRRSLPLGRPTPCAPERGSAPKPKVHRFVFPRPDQPLLAYAAGFRKRELRSLQRGEVRPQETIDLHGHDRGAAYPRLRGAIEDALNRGVRCLLVIHGRGTHSRAGHAVLRRALPGWLCEPPLATHVRAFAPARPNDGGAGALYVLLRRNELG